MNTAPSPHDPARRSGVHGINLDDLLPIPYTEEALAHVVSRVHFVQDFLGCAITLENVSTYVQFEQSAGYLTIILDYRLAPEHPFPAALEDTVFAIRWAKDNARRWNGDGGRIAIGGDSAGANLALSALTSGAPELRSLVRAGVLFYGAYDLQATAQRTRSIPGLQQQLSTYVSGGEGSLDDPRVSPLEAVAPGTLPPCFIIGAGEDTWCLADSLALAQALSAAASPYELHVMEGMPHGFMQMSALDGCRAAMRLMCDFLARNV